MTRLYLKSKWVKDNDVIPRYSPKLGTNQGDAYTNDELLRWRWWRDHNWGKEKLQHTAKPEVLLLKYLHLPLQNPVLGAKLISDQKTFFYCRKEA
jgi:hypothetical protein